MADSRPSAAVPVFNEVEILPELFVRRFMVLNNTNVQSSKLLFAVGISATRRGFQQDTTQHVCFS